MVCEVFCICDMCVLFGNVGLGYVCYVIKGMVLNEEEM